MCSCKGLLPQSSPSHLIHREMTGITIPQQKMLWGSQCITSFFTFAPSLQQLYTGLTASGPPTSRLPQRDANVVTASPDGGSPRPLAEPGGRLRSCPAPVPSLAPPPRPFAKVSSPGRRVGEGEGEGDGGRRAEERSRSRLFLHSFSSATATPQPASRKKIKVQMGEKLGEVKVRGRARGDSAGGRRGEEER